MSLHQRPNSLIVWFETTSSYYSYLTGQVPNYPLLQLLQLKWYWALNAKNDSTQIDLIIIVIENSTNKYKEDNMRVYVIRSM